MARRRGFSVTIATEPLRTSRIARWLLDPCVTGSRKGGRASRFENGSIYFWPDTGAIDLNPVIVHYTGMYAFAETDSDRFGTTSDEPYVLLGVISPSVSFPVVRSQIYVDAGDSRPDLSELCRGIPEGIAISVVLMEHDEGDPDKYRDEVNAGMIAGSSALAAAVTDPLHRSVPRTDRGRRSGKSCPASSPL